jgi:hypothetical protein
MRAAQQAVRDAERRFPVRIKIAVPPEGLAVGSIKSSCGSTGTTLAQVRVVEFAFCHRKMVGLMH